MISVDREISEVTWLGVTLTALCVVISIVMLNAYTGRHMAYDYMDEVHAIAVDLEEGELNQLNESIQEMPAASVLALVRMNDNGINKLYLNYEDLYGQVAADRLYSETGAKTDVYRLFENNIRSKVKLYLEYNESVGGYDFYIHDIGCTSDDYRHAGVCPLN